MTSLSARNCQVHVGVKGLWDGGLEKRVLHMARSYYSLGPTSRAMDFHESRLAPGSRLPGKRLHPDALAMVRPRATSPLISANDGADSDPSGTATLLEARTLGVTPRELGADTADGDFDLDAFACASVLP
jgi:hypothetical protein